MPSLLLVEDDEAVCDALGAILTRAGWEVVAVESAAEAERRFMAAPTEVVLSDLVMPQRGALELLMALRTVDGLLPFVVMSGYLTLQRTRDILLAGASDCLAKPCSTETLIRAVERALMLRNRVQDVVTQGEGEHVINVVVSSDLIHRVHILRQVDEAAQVAGFDPRRNRILLALDEAFENAVRHGARSNSSTNIEVRASFSSHGGVVTVSDPGPGFDPQLVGFDNDNPHGRSGLFLIKAAADDVRWLGRGNVCQMVFRQPGASGVHRVVIPHMAQRGKK